MSVKDEINKSIGAHGMWKQRILSAIKTGQSEWTPEMVRKENQCEFGKWLHSCSPQDKSSPRYNKVRELHANFHFIAAGVLELALAGKKAEAESAIDMKSNYMAISGALTREMMGWIKEVS